MWELAGTAQFLIQFRNTLELDTEYETEVLLFPFLSSFPLFSSLSIFPSIFPSFLLSFLHFSIILTLFYDIFECGQLIMVQKTLEEALLDQNPNSFISSLITKLLKLLKNGGKAQRFFLSHKLQMRLD